MPVKRPILTFAPLLATVALVPSCRDYPGQFRMMCTTAEEVQAELGTVTDARQRHHVWASKVDPKLSGDAKTVFRAIGGMSLDPKKKYEILQQGAAECGVPNYRCDAIQKLFDEAGKE